MSGRGSGRFCEQRCRPGVWLQVPSSFRLLKGRAAVVARPAFEGGGAALPPTDNFSQGGGGGDGDEDSGGDAGQLQVNICLIPKNLSPWPHHSMSSCSETLKEAGRVGLKTKS